MIFYLSISIIILCLYVAFYKIKNRELYYCICVLVVLSLISGLRKGIGVDYKSYFEFYDLYIKNGFTANFEPGYVFVELLCNELDLGFNGVIFITTVITQVCVIIAIYNYSSIPNISAFIYISMGYFYASMTQIRMYIAISVSLLALKYLKDRKIYSYMVIVIIAICFHLTAIVMFPLYFVANRKWNAKQILILFMTCAISFFLAKPCLFFGIRLFPKYEYYLRTSFVKGYGIKSLHRSFLILLPLLIYKKQLLKSKAENIIYINCALYGLIISFMQLQIQLFERFAIYLMMPAALFGWPSIIYSYSKKRERVLVTILICIFTMIYHIYILYKGWMGVIPYQTIWGR